MSYLVSVVVPTKNRYIYLKYLIKLIDSFQLSELEFVIQDNSDNNSEILDFLKEFDNPNIKYYYSSDSLTMSQNGELAIKHALGEYVCYIGDDDGVCRNIVDCVKWMKEKKIEAAYNDNVWYRWEGDARLRRPLKGYSLYSTKKELRRLVRYGCDMTETHIPLIYHGVVKKTVLDKIIDKYGTLFPSVPPDISGSICLASIIDRSCSFKFPVIINGSSLMTGGGVLAKGGVLALEEVGFITQEDIVRWESRIPPIWCGIYAWANSAIKTFTFIGDDDFKWKVNYEFCFAKAVYTRPQKKVLWEMGFKYSKYKLLFLLYTILGFVRNCIRRFWAKRPWSILYKKNVATIIEAEEFFSEHYKKSTLNI